MILAVIFIEIIAAGIIVVMESSDHDVVSKEISLISRVNTDGSGIYISNEYVPSDFITIDDDGTVTYNAPMWEKKVFGTPGASTIQHIQLMTIVVEEMGFNFQKYSDNEKLKEGTVYFVDNITNYTMAVNNKSILDGGILWEPQYHYIADDPSFKELVTTNVLFPGHTCCLIGGYQSYLDSHPDETARFLAAFIESVDYLNAAKADPDCAEYKQIIQICLDNIPGLTPAIIEESLSTVIYTYSDTIGTSNLESLKKDIASLAKNLGNIGVLKRDVIKDLGFKSYEAFADAFVDNSYLSKALKINVYDGPVSTIKVGAIDGDIHQIALQIGITLGIFEKYGLDVSLNKFANGGLVAQDILSGQSDLGFMGAPPITSATINGEKIRAEGE